MLYKLAETKRKTMKTAMQEAIEKLRSEIEQKGSLMGLGIAIAIDTLSDLLAKERQQIEYAFSMGSFCGMQDAFADSPDFENASDYYTKNYNNESI
jgi:hypothetical protein